MNTEVQIYGFNGNNVRLITDDMGDPWFVAKDVCDVLGYSNPRDAIAKHTKAKSTVAIHDGRQNRNLTIIPERDVYRLIMRSHLLEAEQFEEWVVAEVLPSIRKHGMYATPITLEEMLNDPDTMIQTLQKLKEERKLRLLAEQKIEEDAPKVEQYQRFMGSEDLFAISDLAKALSVGPRFLADYMRHLGILCNSEGIFPKEPHGAKYFKVVTHVTPDKKARKYGKLTAVGFDHFIKRFHGLTNQQIKEALGR